MQNMEQQFSDPIPVDLLIDVFSRVPSKSIARFRCVSKLWASLLGRPDFTELFLTKSLARPRLLFTLKVERKLLFFFSPQPQNIDENSSLVVTSYRTYFPKRTSIFSRSQLCGSPIRGFFCLEMISGRKDRKRVIFNPVTGETINLPKLKGKNINTKFGYDPVEKMFKVLCMYWSRFKSINTHRVLTLETGRLIWRTIECKPHFPRNDGACINGVLYYPARFEESTMIVCFDVRSESFDFINTDVDMLPSFDSWTLINCRGKLSAYEKYRDENEEEVVLWVLENAGKHKWSKSICVLPPLLIENSFYIVGMTGTGEILLSSHRLSNPFHVFCYNFERSTFTRVNTVFPRGFQELKYPPTLYTFQDYVEDMKPM